MDRKVRFEPGSLEISFEEFKTIFVARPDHVNREVDVVSGSFVSEKVTELIGHRTFHEVASEEYVSREEAAAFMKSIRDEAIQKLNDEIHSDIAQNYYDIQNNETALRNLKNASELDFVKIGRKIRLASDLQKKRTSLLDCKMYTPKTQRPVYGLVINEASNV